MKHNRRHFKCVSKQHKSENVRSFFNKFSFLCASISPGERAKDAKQYTQCSRGDETVQ